jgi:hypothetical protein
MSLFQVSADRSVKAGLICSAHLQMSVLTRLKAINADLEIGAPTRDPVKPERGST